MVTGRTKSFLKPVADNYNKSNNHDEKNENYNQIKEQLTQASTTTQHTRGTVDLAATAAKPHQQQVVNSINCSTNTNSRWEGGITNIVASRDHCVEFAPKECIVQHLMA